MNKIPKEILEDMNYMNLAEIRSLSDVLGIPYKILYKKGNRFCKTSTFDRKDVLLERIRSYATTGKLPDPTVLAEKIVDLGPIPAKPKETDLIKFGQFKHGHKGIEGLLEKISDGAFKDGAIARDVLRDAGRSGADGARERDRRRARDRALLQHPARWRPRDPALRQRHGLVHRRRGQAHREAGLEDRAS